MNSPRNLSHLSAVLRSVWGFHEFRPLQAEAMQAILDRQDSLVVLPTGSGKSVCFQAPALLETGRGLALVISPLIALMKDQVDGLRAQGVAAAALHSALDARERDGVLRSLDEGRLRLLYLSPERAVGEGAANLRERLRRAAVSPGFIAIDEAHCISQWGHDFRPEYRRLRTLRDSFPEASLHAFTATATARVRRDIVDQLGLLDPRVLVGSFDRPNLTYRVLRRSNAYRQILEVIRRHRDEAGIVYCISRRQTEELSERLRVDGVQAVAYHAGLPDAERHLRQEAFSEERLDVIVATVAFGMGIDRSNVRLVLHAGAPRSLEHYQQEAGRAGRDGLPAECVLIWSPSDVMTWRRLLEASAAEAGEAEPPPGALEQLRQIGRYAASTSCRHRALVEHFGQTLEGASSCGACDRCLGELLPVDEPVEVARKILSCVLRVRESFGLAHVVDVLRGRDTDRVREKGHHELSTHGLLSAVSADEVRAYAEQLVEQELLAVDGDRYPVLRVTAQGRALLRDETAVSVSLVRAHVPPSTRAAQKTPKKGGSAAIGLDAESAGLFERLREERRKIASERGVPPYVVFHDSTLREIARLRPRSAMQLLSVAGVGQAKERQFGERFLAVVAAFASDS